MNALCFPRLLYAVSLALFALVPVFGEIALLGVAGGASRAKDLPAGTTLPADASFRFNSTGVADLLLTHAPIEGVDDEALASAAAATRLDGLAATIAVDHLHVVLGGGLLTAPADADRPLAYARGAARLEMRMLQGGGGGGGEAVWELAHSAAGGAVNNVRALALTTGAGSNDYTLAVHGRINVSDVILPASPALQRAFVTGLQPPSTQNESDEEDLGEADGSTAVSPVAHSLQAILIALADALSSHRSVAQGNHTALQASLTALQEGLGALDTAAAANHSALVTGTDTAMGDLVQQLGAVNASHAEVRWQLPSPAPHALTSNAPCRCLLVRSSLTPLTPTS